MQSAPSTKHQSLSGKTKSATWNIPNLLIKINEKLKRACEVAEEKYRKKYSREIDASGTDSDKIPLIDRRAFEFVGILRQHLDKTATEEITEENQAHLKLLEIKDIIKESGTKQKGFLKQGIHKTLPYKKKTVDRASNFGDFDTAINAAHYLVLIRNWLIRKGHQFGFNVVDRFKDLKKTYRVVKSDIKAAEAPAQATEATGLATQVQGLSMPDHKTGEDSAIPQEKVSDLHKAEELLTQFQFSFDEDEDFDIGTNNIDDLRNWAYKLWEQVNPENNSAIDKEIDDFIADFTLLSKVNSVEEKKQVEAGDAAVSVEGVMQKQSFRRVGLVGLKPSRYFAFEMLQDREIYVFTKPGEDEEECKNFATRSGATWVGSLSDEGEAPKLDAVIIFNSEIDLIPAVLNKVSEGTVVLCGPNIQPPVKQVAAELKVAKQGVAEQNSEDEVLVFSFDDQGCIFNSNYDDDKATREPIRTVKHNRPLLNHVSTLIEENKSSVPPVFSNGSDAQSRSIAKVRSETNQTPTIFDALKVIAKNVSETTDKPVTVDPCVLEDITSERPVGSNFDTPDLNGSDQRDESKFLLLYFQIHRAASLNKNKKVSYHFYEHDRRILDNLKKFLENEKNQDLFPDNVTIHLHRYDGDEVKSFGKPIKGKGNIDFKYDQHIKKVIKTPPFNVKTINAISLFNEDQSHLKKFRKIVQSFVSPSSFFGKKRAENPKKEVIFKKSVGPEEKNTLAYAILDDNQVDIRHGVGVHEKGYRAVDLKSVEVQPEHKGQDGKEQDKPQDSQDNVFEVLSHNVKTTDIYRSLNFLAKLKDAKAEEAGVSDKTKVSEFKTNLLTYQLDHVKEVHAWQEDLKKVTEHKSAEPPVSIKHDDSPSQPGPDLKELPASEQHYRDICLGIQDIILQTKWDLGVFGGEKIKGHNVKVPKNIYAIWLEIEQVKSQEKVQSWEQTITNIKAKADNALTAKNSSKCCFNRRGETTTLFYRKIQHADYSQSVPQENSPPGP